MDKQFTTANTKEDFERFFKSSVWQDLEGMLLDNIESERDTLEKLSTVNSDPNLLGVVGGRIEQMRALLDWPNSVPAYAELLEEAGKMSKEGEEDAGDS